MYSKLRMMLFEFPMVKYEIQIASINASFGLSTGLP